MSLRFYFGSSGAGKSSRLYQEIIERSKRSPERNFFVIVPDQFTMQTQKELVDAHPDGVIMNIDVLSFGRLSHRIFEEVGYDLRPVLDDTGKSLVLRKVAAAMQEELPVLGGNLGKQGYIHEVKSAVSEFMQYGIGTKELEQLTDYARKRGALYYKLKDLQKLYEGFLSYIQGQFITTEETLDLLRASLSKSRLIKESVVAFDGFTGFTPIQNRLMQEIMRLADEVIVTVTLPEGENPFQRGSEQELFDLSKKTVGTLCRLAGDVSVGRGKDVWLDKRVWRFKENGKLAHLEKNLFRYPLKPYMAPAGNKDGIDLHEDRIAVYEAESPKEEVRQTAMQIRALVRREGYLFRDIAVVCGDLGAYAEHIEEQFALFDIPCFLDQTRGILLNPFIEFMRSAISIFTGDFSYEAVFHYLRSGLADFTSDEVDRFENYALQFGIHGKWRYTRAFTKRTRQMEENPDSFNEINLFRERFLDSLQPLFRKEGTAGQYVEDLYEFLVRSRVQEKLAGYEKRFEEQGELSKAREYAQIYPMVMDLLDQIMGLLGQETMSLQDFADILDAGFGEIEVGTIPQNVDRIIVGDMERTRLKPVRALFFLGVNDGNIPRGTSKGGIISDIDREFLRESDFELAPSPRQQMYIQRFYLYLNLTKPSEKLFLSYSNINGEGKSLRPAYLIDTMRKLFPEVTVEYPGRRPAEEQLETPAEGLRFLARWLREYAQGNLKEKNETTLFFTLYEACKAMPGNESERQKLTEAAFWRYRHHPLAKEVARRLYGVVMENSVTRLETYASCAYEHFLEYGLSLQERKEYGFEAVDMGNVFHTVLERFAEKLTSKGLTWFSFSREEGEAMIAEALEECSAEYGDTVLFSSARNTYMIERMKRILTRTVTTLQSQLRKGSFEPASFEMSFNMIRDLDSLNISLTGEEKMRLRGRIDRVDTWEEGDRLYVKIIDYKSGNRQFDLAALYYGLQLQLVVYLNAAVDMQKRKHPDKEVLPAALLYYHISDPVISAQEAMTPEEVNEKLLSELKMTGIVNDDISVIKNLDTELSEENKGSSQVIPVELKKDGTISARSSVLSSEDLVTVSDYVNKKIRQIGREILDGNFPVNPYEKGSRTACAYCAYKSVCGFDKHVDGYEMRVLEDFSKEEILLKIRNGEKDGGSVYS